MNSVKEIYSGFLLVNKPSGPTSHDMVNRLRRITGIKKIGHAGTLDPFASGLLIMAIGREATKKISEFAKLDKEYVATLHLGAETDTYDRMGKIIRQLSIINYQLSIHEVEEVLKAFVGKQLQTPPMFSAKKVDGRKLYELARKGIEIKRAPVEIEIRDISILDYQSPLLKIKVHCSTGTYIRSLASDIGKKLGCGAYLEELQRTAIGEFRIEKALKLEEIEKNGKINYLVLSNPENSG